MFRFAFPEYMFLLLSIPVLIVAFIIFSRKKRRDLMTFGDKALVEELMPNASRVRPAVKFSILLIALTFLIIGLARPQFGMQEQTIKRQGIEVMIALDISNSMLAEDVFPNRLDRAKQIISRLIDQMPDDKIGMVVFAGDAFVQLPITADNVSAKMFLDNISPSLIKTQGTAIGAAISTSLKAFGGESEASRAIILITDGEDHEDDALQQAQKASENGVQIFVVGIGKPEGAPIPVPGTMSYHKDRQGNVVISHLNEDMCKEIASEASGMYVRADNSNNVTKTISKELDQLAKSEIESQMYVEYNEQYQSFVLIGLLLLIIDFFILNRKNKRLSRINIFNQVTQ